MKKQLKFTLALALSLALLFSLGAAAFADTAEDGLPLEYVSYGVGLPDPAPVDMHELGAEDITLEGVSYDARTEDGHIYIRLSDLAAAKLLRESRDKAAELGLDYAKIYIADGVIFAKDTGNADEVKEVQGLISALKQGAAIGISVDDIFDLGNAGDVKLHVKIRGFAYGDAGSGASSGGSTGEKRALDVKALDKEKSIERPEVTTVYFYYYGLTGYDTVLYDDSEGVCYSEGEDGGNIDLGGGNIDLDGGDIGLIGGGDEEEPVKPVIKTQRAFSLGLALAYSQKDIGDGVQYYVWINGKNIKIPPLNGGVEWLDDEGSFLAKDASGMTESDLFNNSDIMGGLTNTDFDFDSLPTVEIKVTTDAAGNNVVKTIDFNNVTPTAKEVLNYNEDSNTYAIKDEAPEGYEPDNKRTYDPSDAFVPKDKNMDVPDDAIGNSDVTIDVRDDIIFDDLEPKCY